MADISDPNWSETDGNNTGAPPLGWPANMAPNQVEPTSRAMMGAIKRFWDRANAIVTTTGAAGTYTYTTANAALPASYIQGETYVFKAHQTGIGSDTFQVNALGAKPIYVPGSITQRLLVPNDIVQGSIYGAVYDGALGGAGAFQLVYGSLPVAVRGIQTAVANAVPGIVGEYISSVVVQANGITIPLNFISIDITSIQLTAGDWDVWGEVWWHTVSGTFTLTKSNAWINTVSATAPLDASDGVSMSTLNPEPNPSNWRQPIGALRTLLSATTTYYLSAGMLVASGIPNVVGFGRISARRRR